jgi:hypothetical protein
VKCNQYCARQSYDVIPTQPDHRRRYEIARFADHDLSLSDSSKRHMYADSAKAGYSFISFIPAPSTSRD